MRSLFNRQKKGKSNGEPSAATRLTTKSGSSEGRKERVLVMDDDAFVRGVIRSILVDSGYEVRLAKNGAETIKYFKEAKDLDSPFDTVIMDLHVTSGMGGAEAIELLRAIDPRVRAILLTGDINHPFVTNYDTLGFKAALIKPFTRNDLVNALYSASDES